jgi:hypothetical protein
LQAELLEQGREATEWEQWPPALAQIRISAADTKWNTYSTSPERQVEFIARYCAAFKFRPIELCFEAQSGSLSEKGRKLLTQYFERIQSGELDVAAVLTYNIDRFTRNRLTGEQWIHMLKERGIDLHETDEKDPPKPLIEREEEYADKLQSAARESARAAKRIRDSKAHLAATGRITTGVDHFGHRPIREISADGNRVLISAEIMPEEAEVLREATKRLHAGATLGAIARDLNAQGIRGRYGAPWSHGTLRDQLISPRLAGLERQTDGTLAPRAIEPILSEQEWQKNGELLTVQPRDTQRAMSLSHLCQCPICDLRMTHHATAAGEIGRYICKRSGHAPGRAQQDSGLCDCAGGVRHPSINATELDSLLLQAALAAVSALPDALDALSDSRVKYEDGRASERLQVRLARLADERRAVAKRGRQGLLDQAETDQQMHVLQVRERAIKDELEGLLGARIAHVPAARDIGALATKAASERGAAHQLIEMVIDYCQVWPHEIGTSRFDRRVDFVFKEPYSLPQESTDSLLAECANSRRVAYRQRSARFWKWPEGTTRADADAALRLYDEGFTYTDVAREFARTLRSQGDQQWDTETIRRLINIGRAKQGLPSESRPDTTSPFEYRVRELVYSLCTASDTSYADVAARLTQMRAADHTWSDTDVRDCYAATRQERGELGPLGRAGDA